MTRALLWHCIANSAPLGQAFNVYEKGGSWDTSDKNLNLLWTNEVHMSAADAIYLAVHSILQNFPQFPLKWWLHKGKIIVVDPKRWQLYNQSPAPFYVCSVCNKCKKEHRFNYVTMAIFPFFFLNTPCTSLAWLTNSSPNPNHFMGITWQHLTTEHY